MRDGEWSRERNYTVVAGDKIVVRPHFDRSEGLLEDKPRELHSPELGIDVRYRVHLPPSYGEHPDRRYPVLYAQDGQALFSNTGDQHGPPWRVDETLDELYELAAVEEIIVVGIETAADRLRMLSPSRDKKHGGGDGPKYLDFLVERLKPEIDRRYRTSPERADTGLMGASMGGLFSFFAAWRRPDVFGKAACLSSSFWWDDRFMVKEVRGGSCPAPRPLLYIDSGAAKSDLDEDMSRRDGYHHTVAMRDALTSHCYAPGVNVHLLAFAGSAHESSAWAARVATPLQLLFPRELVQEPSWDTPAASRRT
jgi:predicted alpha/beta superfamily hydrolase